MRRLTSQWIVVELDSLCWFSQHRSPTPHFGGAHPGHYDIKFELAEIFVQCTCPQISSSYVYSFGSYRVDKETNRRRWKHPTLFATLQCWVIVHRVEWVWIWLCLLHGVDLNEVRHLTAWLFVITLLEIFISVVSVYWLRPNENSRYVLCSSVSSWSLVGSNKDSTHVCIRCLIFACVAVKYFCLQCTDTWLGTSEGTQPIKQLAPFVPKTFTS